MLTSGGDSPGMNAAVRAVVRVGIARGLKVFWVQRGFSGLLAGDIAEVGRKDVSGWMQLGGSKIGCARCPEMFEDHAPLAAANILKRREIDGLVVIGGEGSFRGALKIAEHGMPVAGLPGTIDNDIPGTERTIGFDTACDTLADCLGKLRDTAASHNRTFVVEAMGSNTGWLALYGGIAGGADVILIPEIPWSKEEVLERLMQRVANKKTFHLVVISEGAGRCTDLAGWLQAQTPDELEVRVTIPGHIQRGGTPSTTDRLFASRCGQGAVEALLGNRGGVMVGEQKGRMVEVPLESATQGPRSIDRKLYELALVLA